jgi:aspartate-semialdehyde dehydrogenase
MTFRIEKGDRVAIVGASSLRGKELKELLDERAFPAGEIRLLDEEVAVGTLTEAGGEPVIIGLLDEESFEGMRFVFFAGGRETARQHAAAALRAGATVIDLTEPGEPLPEAALWIPALDATLAPPEAPRGPAPAEGLSTERHGAAKLRPAGGKLFRSPAPPVIVACGMAAALRGFPLARLVLVFFQPVSERGQSGVDELEGQTINLLSFRPVSQEVFGAQVAFNLLGSYGEASAPSLASLRGAIVGDVARYLAGRLPVPAIQLVHAPVFYSYAFTAFAELTAAHDPRELEAAIAAAGMRVQTAEEAPPSNLSVTGEAQPVIGRIERDPGCPAGYWLWGAGDNLRLAAANAVAIAERLVAN